MTAKQLGETPIYPTRDSVGCPATNGMTLRQLYVGMAMQGMLADAQNFDQSADTVAKWSVECADALLEALAKETQP